MFQKKPPKSELPDKNEYTIHWIHSTAPVKPNWSMMPVINLVAADPGRSHFAIRMEQRNQLAHITPLVFAKMDLEKYATDPDTGSTTLYTELIKFLDRYRTQLYQSHLVMIERQLPINYRMVRLSQAILDYFIHLLKDAPHLPLIIEMAPNLKTRIMKAPNSMSEKQTKLWSETCGVLLLMARKDYQSLTIINQTSIEKGKAAKINDLTDTVVMIEAICLWYDMLGKTNQIELEKYNGWIVRFERRKQSERGCWLLKPQKDFFANTSYQDMFNQISLDKTTGQIKLTSGLVLQPDRIKLLEWIEQSKSSTSPSPISPSPLSTTPFTFSLSSAQQVFCRCPSTDKTISPVTTTSTSLSLISNPSTNPQLGTFLSNPTSGTTIPNTTLPIKASKLVFSLSSEPSSIGTNDSNSSGTVNPSSNISSLNLTDFLKMSPTNSLVKGNVI